MIVECLSMAILHKDLTEEKIMEGFESIKGVKKKQ